MNPTLFRAEGLVVRYPEPGGWWRRYRDVVKGVSFSVGHGEIVALVGESGSGKSTIGRVVAGLEKPFAGRMWLEGRELGEREAERPIQMVFQDPFASLNPAHRIAHAIERPLRLRGKGGDLAVEVGRCLQAVGLDPAFARRYPFELSGGQRQRVAIARALAMEPLLLVADEPTSMLDVSIRMEILSLFQQLRAGARRSVLLITHDLGSARMIADRVIVLQGGEIVEEGSADQVFLRPKHPYAQSLAAASRRGSLTENAKPSGEG
jgi:peptide/nickel transport system ATP-binding protein